MLSNTSIHLSTGGLNIGAISVMFDLIGAIERQVLRADVAMDKTWFGGETSVTS